VRSLAVLLALLAAAICVLLLMGALPGERGAHERVAHDAPAGDEASRAESLDDEGANRTDTRIALVAPHPEAASKAQEVPADETSPKNDLAARYPLIADAIELDGVALADLDLATLEVREYWALQRSVRRVANAEEAAIVASIPYELREVLTTGEAKERRAASPESYLVALPVPASTPFGQEPYLDVSALMTPALEQARGLDFDLHNQPRFVELKTQAALARLPEGSRPIFEWVLENHGATRVALDANGHEVVRIGERYLGMP